MSLTETPDVMPGAESRQTNLAGSYKKIAENIRDALALSRKLEIILSAAHEKMLNRDIAGLEGLLEIQVKLLNMLQLNASLREHYLTDIGLPANRQGMEQFMNFCSACDGMDKVISHWQQLNEYANRCRNLNRANGRLLSRLAASTNRIIELVFTEQEPSTYNEQGICELKIG